MASSYSAEYKTVQAKLHQADMVITSNTQNIGVLDFLKAKEAIEGGYAAAKEILSKQQTHLENRPVR